MACSRANFFTCSRLVVLCLGTNAFLFVDQLFYATSRYVVELNYIHLKFSTLFCTYDSDGPKRAVEGRYNGNEQAKAEKTNCTSTLSTMWSQITFICTFSSYRSVNTFHLGYKNESVNAVQ
jgi:hypothetical protein